VRALLAIALLAQVCALSACGGSKLTPQDDAKVSAETAMGTLCVTDNKGDAGAIDACRAHVRAYWDAYWASYFDGGKGQ